MPNPPKPGGLDKKMGGLKNKWWLIGGGGVVAIGGYMYYARNSSGSSAASNTTSAAQSATDPSIDPSTGIPYAEEAAYNSYGEYGGYSSGTGGYVGSSGSAGTVTTPGVNADGSVTLSPADEAALTGISTDQQNTDNVLSDLAGELGNIGMPAPGTAETNQQWARAAEAKLESEGVSKHAAIAAIGAYLSGAPLTKTQEQHVQTAVGHVGAPPTPAPRVKLVVPKKPAKKPTAKKPAKINTKARL